MHDRYRVNNGEYDDLFYFFFIVSGAELLAKRSVHRRSDGGLHEDYYRVR